MGSDGTPCRHLLHWTQELEVKLSKEKDCMWKARSIFTQMRFSYFFFFDINQQLLLCIDSKHLSFLSSKEEMGPNPVPR